MISKHLILAEEDSTQTQASGTTCSEASSEQGLRGKTLASRSGSKFLKSKYWVAIQLVFDALHDPFNNFDRRVTAILAICIETHIELVKLVMSS